MANDAQQSASQRDTRLRVPWIMRMTWSELLFAHWQMEPEAVARHLPRGLELDTRDGTAWVGVVPFLMSGVAPRACPPIPKLSRFLELNLRTYVRFRNKPGVWFFSLEAENPIAVRMARAVFHLPYMDARMSLQHQRTNDTHGNSDSSLKTRVIDYRSMRTHRGEPQAEFDGSYQALGDVFEAAPGSLEHWLTARYCLYSADRKGTIYCGDIDHPPWRLQRAVCEIRTNTLGRPWDFEFNGQPHMLFAQPIHVHAWLLTKVA